MSICEVTAKSASLKSHGCFTLCWSDRFLTFRIKKRMFFKFKKGRFKSARVYFSTPASFRTFFTLRSDIQPIEPIGRYFFFLSFFFFISSFQRPIIGVLNTYRQRISVVRYSSKANNWIKYNQAVLKNSNNQRQTFFSPLSDPRETV